MAYVYRAFKDLPIEYQESEKHEGGVFTLDPELVKKLKYPHWAPTWETEQELAFNSIEPFRHVDRGRFGDPSFDSLFKGTGAIKKELTPRLGLEIKDLQLSQLDATQKDDLALLVEQRGVVVFRDQDFKDSSFDDLRKWGKYYGPLHTHSVSGAPLGQPEFHIYFAERENDAKNRFLETHTGFHTWHHDVSFEGQPPGITAVAMLQAGNGGDIQFIDTIAAYERLSPTFQQFIGGLRAVHTSELLVKGARAQGGIVRKPALNTIHPIVRYHSVLKKKALYVNPPYSSICGFTRRILGLKNEESDALLLFLWNHINSLLDAHIRVSWDDRTVVLWDNRHIIHTAITDIEPDSLRTAFRVTSVAERPVANEDEFNSWTPEKEKDLIEHTDEYLGLTPEEYYEKRERGLN
ncbi:DEKNAAC104650 [Brettanomyces naardenensis]|uniref:DEKNAAC104650 n=1 Tax=Brettanomyces naardenensis TaxID=13370 RepID=A0A448YRE2_BRENA|nr:DEKNAAC104650 [Brettanomyces naardenensis]